MKLPGNSTWTAGTCIGEAGPHSYKVQIGDSIYRRNRRQLISPRNDDHQASPDRTPGDQTAPEDLETQLTPSGSSQETNLPSEPVETPMQRSSLGISSPRRSSRSCHPPSWIYMLFAGWEVRIVKNCDRVAVTELTELPEAAGRGQHFQDRGHSFSLYGPT